MKPDERCEAFEVVAPEFALGLLGGHERADAIAHLDACARCRALVDELAETGDALLLAVPGEEPSAGFEARVLARTEPAAESMLKKPRARRRFTGAGRFGRLGWLAAAVCAAALAGTLVLGGGTKPALAEADMVTPSGQHVGEVYLHRGSDAWVLVAVPGWKQPAGQQEVDYELRLTDTHGNVSIYPGLRLDNGHGAWGTTINVQSSDVMELALVDASGRVWCAATLG